MNYFMRIAPFGNQRINAYLQLPEAYRSLSRLWERWCVFWHLHFSRQRLWEVDVATSGTDITRLRVLVCDNSKRKET